MKTFDDQNKFTVMVRIGQEVYLAVVDGVLDFNDRKIQMLLVDCNEVCYYFLSFSCVLFVNGVRIKFFFLYLFLIRIFIRILHP